MRDGFPIPLLCPCCPTVVGARMHTDVGGIIPRARCVIIAVLAGPEEKGLQATVEEAEGTTDFGASVPSLLSKYQDTPSHDLPAMSVLFEGLMS